MQDRALEVLGAVQMKALSCQIAVANQARDKEGIGRKPPFRTASEQLNIRRI